MPGKTIQALYLSYDGMTDPLGQSQVIPYLAGLTKQNIRFTLISFEKPDAFARSGEAVRAQLDASGIRWIPLTYTKRPPVLSTLYDIWKLKRAVKALLEQEQIDLIHCRSYITALIGNWAKKQFGVRFLFDMRGLWADERVDGKLWDLRNPVYNSVYRYFKKKELEFLRSADHTISLTQAAKREILSWPALQGRRIPITVIPCCVDTQLFDRHRIRPEDLAAWRKKLEIGAGAFVISYVGSIGTWYMLDEMLTFFKKLRDARPEACLLFITRGEHERIRKQAAAVGVSDSIRIQGASREDVPVLLSLSAYSIFFILPAYSKMASSPTKQGEIMALGIPAVCNPGVGDTEEIVRQYHSGCLADPARPDDVVHAIASGSVTFSAEAIAGGARDYFALERGIAEYLNVYRAILSGPVM